MSTVSERRTLGRRGTSQIIVCRPRHRSFFFFLFLTTILVNGWSRGAGIYPAASDRSITEAGGWNAPLLFLAIRRCGTVHADCFSFRYVSALQLHGKPARTGINLTLRWQNERMDVHRE